MSRRKFKKRSQASVQRATMPGIPVGGNMYVIPESMMQAVFMQQSPQKNTLGESMLPGAPLEPYKGIIPASGPRQFSFPVGWNIGRNNDRAMYPGQEIPTFHQLRTLARTYDGIQMCLRVWLDMVAKLKLEIKPRPDLLKDGDDEDQDTWQKAVAPYQEFFAKPDRVHSLHEWLRMAITEQLEIDALAIYLHPTRGGDLYAMEILDGATIKPLLDDRGMAPQAPYPAFQQYLYGGLPGAWLTSDQLIYIRESPRADSPYGISRVERIIMRVNQALRKQQKDLARFTDGNIPPGFLQLPASDTQWTADEIAAYQQMFDALLAGNDPLRSRIKIIPPGSEYIGVEEPAMATEFDQYLLNVAAASFGLSMAELAFTQDVNRSSGDSQENMTYRRTLEPIIAMYANLFTDVIKYKFNDDRFFVTFSGYEESEDLEMQASAYSTLVQSGILSVSDAARKMQLPVSCEIPIFVMTKTGPMFLEDLVNPKLRQAQMDAQMAGLQLAASNPGAGAAKQNSGNDGSEQDDTPSDSGADQNASSSGGDSSSEEDDEDDDTDPEQQQRLIKTEYRQWRDVALKDVKSGKPVRQFHRSVIPEDEYNRMHIALQQCKTADDVRSVFRGDTSFFGLASREAGENQQVSNLLWRNMSVRS
jgi:hypothetical protein